MKKSTLDKTIILSSHPISINLREKIEISFKEVTDYIALNTLKGQGSKFAIKKLLATKASRVVIFFETEDDMVFKNLLCICSFLISSNDRYFYLPDCTIRNVSVLSFLRAFIETFLATILSFRNGLLACWELGRLSKIDQTKRKIKINSEIIYLNTNLMHGVKAGGSLGHISGVINGFFSQNFKLTYVSTKKLFSINKLIPYLKLNLPNTITFPHEFFLFSFGQSVSKQLSSYLGKGTSKLIYQRMSRCNYSGASLKHKLKIPFILEYNGSEVWAAKNWGHSLIFEKLAEKAEILSLKSADFVVTVSEILAKEVETKGICRSKIIVYPNCVDSKIFDPKKFDKHNVDNFRSKLGIGSDSIVFGFIGTFGTWHGIDFLSNTIKELITSHLDLVNDNKLKFLIVGDGHHRHSVESLIQDDTYSKYIIWPGLVEQSTAPQYLAAMDVLLSPHIPNPDGSKFFGSPTKLFEYMSMNKPIIAAQLEQISDILSPSLHALNLPEKDPNTQNQEMAILITPGNNNQLINAIIFLIKNKSWRNVLALNARKKVLSNYQWKNHVKHIIEHINKNDR